MPPSADAMSRGAEVALHEEREMFGKFWAVAAIAATLAVAGCGGTPGASDSEGSSTATEPVKTTISDDPVTLTIVDTGTDAGPDAEYKALIALFEEQHPNVTVKRTAKPFANLLSTVKLQLSSAAAPDVTEGNPGPQVDGALVRGRLIRPLTAYASAYGWDKIWPASTQATNMYSEDGKEFGTGALWGVSAHGEVVGVFYNKAMLRQLGLQEPKTFAEFEAALAKAKSAGKTPLMIGEQDRYPGGHALMTLVNHYADPAGLRDWVFGRQGASVENGEVEQAAAKLQEWAEKDYFQRGFLGVKDAEAQARMAKGQALFTIGVSVLNGSIEPGLKEDLGFMLMPPETAGEPVFATGSLSPGQHISSRSKHPDVAAAWLNLLASEEGAQTMLKHGGLPSRPLSKPAVDPQSSLASILEAWRQTSGGGRLVPYLDSATSTMYDTLTGGVQELMGGGMSPDAFVKAIQADWDKAHGAS
jgi:raffinose/stachyose/melibiose transport system substrate-binding protein